MKVAVCKLEKKKEKRETKPIKHKPLIIFAAGVNQGKFCERQLGLTGFYLVCTTWNFGKCEEKCQYVIF